MAEFIPAGPSELTADWVTTALRAAGALPAGRVVEFDVEPLTGGGTGIMGDTVRLRLRYDGEGTGPASVIAKFPTDDRQNRALLEQYDAYAREILFYEKYSHRVPVPTPAYMGAAFDPGRNKAPGPMASKVIDALPVWVKRLIFRNVTLYLRPTKRRYALLIEDLGADITVHDLEEPPDDDKLGAAIEMLAGVHAEFWEHDALHDDDMFQPLVTTTPGLYDTIARRWCLPMARARWDWFTDEDAALIEDAIDRLPGDIETINRPTTLVHGDPRSDNVLYRDDGDVVLLDWAMAAHAHPGWDVGYLLSSCLAEERIEATDALIARYEAAMVERGVEVGGADLRSGIDATYRAVAVQQLMSIAVLDGNYGDQALADLWMPRILAGLRRRRPRLADAA
jgi:hypothetical protein